MRSWLQPQHHTKLDLVKKSVILALAASERQRHQKSSRSTLFQTNKGKGEGVGWWGGGSWRREKIGRGNHNFLRNSKSHGAKAELGR